MQSLRQGFAGKQFGELISENRIREFRKGKQKRENQYRGIFSVGHKL